MLVYFCVHHKGQIIQFKFFYQKKNGDILIPFKPLFTLTQSGHFNIPKPLIRTLPNKKKRKFLLLSGNKTDANQKDLRRWVEEKGNMSFNVKSC